MPGQACHWSLAPKFCLGKGYRVPTLSPTFFMLGIQMIYLTTLLWFAACPHSSSSYASCTWHVGYCLWLWTQPERKLLKDLELNCLRKQRLLKVEAATTSLIRIPKLGGKGAIPLLGIDWLMLPVRFRESLSCSLSLASMDSGWMHSRHLNMCTLLIDECVCVYVHMYVYIEPLL